MEVNDNINENGTAGAWCAPRCSGALSPEDAERQVLKEQQLQEAHAAHRKTTAAKLCVAAALVAAVAFFGFNASTPSSESAVQASNGEAASAPAAAQSAANADSYRTVVDTEGRSVEIPATPQKVAVMDSFAAELSVMLGAGSQLYSIPAGTMSDQILQSMYPQLTSLAEASGSQVNIEDLVAAQVDLALVKGTLPETERAKLDVAKIPYVVVSYETLDEQMDALCLVANVLGEKTQAAGEKMHNAFTQMIETVDAHSAQIPAEQRVRVYHAINSALLTDAAHSLGASWITRAGALCVSADEAATSGSDYTATLEAVYSWNPHAIICNVASTADALRTDAQWQAMEAVAQGEVYAIPIGATRWGQRGSVETPLAMLWLGCTLYPQVYSDVDLKTVVADFYETCLGVEMDDALYEQIMSGKGIRADGTGSGLGEGQSAGGGR